MLASRSILAQFEFASTATIMASEIAVDSVWNISARLSWLFPKCPSRCLYGSHFIHASPARQPRLSVNQSFCFVGLDAGRESWSQSKIPRFLAASAGALRYGESCSVVVVALRRYRGREDVRCDGTASRNTGKDRSGFVQSRDERCSDSGGDIGQH
jgi:hypothetical protein